MQPHFISGLLWYAAVHSLMQDALGQERYIAMCRDAWLSPWITVPLAILMMIAGHILAKEGSK